jgi:organic hydroperoxide reductase OsmC/OhrA
VLAKDPQGRIAMTVVTLRPRIAFSGDKRPSQDDLDQLHHKSHEACYIANSVRSEVRIEPR